MLFGIINETYAKETHKLRRNRNGDLNLESVSFFSGAVISTHKDGYEARAAHSKLLKENPPKGFVTIWTSDGEGEDFTRRINPA